MTLIVDVFPKLRTPKNVVKQLSKKSRVIGPFDKQHGKGDQTRLKIERHQLYQIFWSLWRILSYKKSLLVICKVLKMFVNILTADDKYFLLNRDNLRKPIHIRLSEIQKAFWDVFSQILKSRLNFEHFPNKDHAHSWCISEITNSKNVVK